MTDQSVRLQPDHHGRPDRSVDRFDADPTKSFTLAADFYTDPEIYRQEQTQIFWKSWMLVAHVSEFSEPGAYSAVDVAGQRVFVIRSAGGELRAFFNVCQHRGHALLEGSGVVSNLITCPYHAWAYDTAGDLKGARMSDRMEDFDYADFTLPSVAVDEFCGMVFVNLDPAAEPMRQLYPGAEEAILARVPNPEALVKAMETPFEIAANWKNVGDNLLECYHCHPAHKEFVELIDMVGYRNETYPNWAFQTGPSRPVNNVYDTGTGSDGFWIVYLWPTCSFGQLPGHEGLFMFTFAPIAVEQTYQLITYYSPTAELNANEEAAFDYFNNVLGPEDVALVESVQVGLNSLGYHQGRFICIPDRPEISEHAVHHFHAMVRTALDV